MIRCMAIFLVVSVLGAVAVIAETVALRNPQGGLVAIVNTDQMQYAIASEASMIIQFAGDSENRLTIDRTSSDAAQVFQSWLLQLNEEEQ